MRTVAKAVLVTAFLAGVPALAEEQPPSPVGRFAGVSGELGVHGKGEPAWSKASVNSPVATAETFRTDSNSRAELRVGSRSIAISGDTELDVTKLDQQVMQLRLTQGR